MEARDLALGFVRAVVAGEYDKAHDLLSLPLQWQVSPAKLAEDYVAMHSYAPETPDTVEHGDLLDAHLPDAVGWQWVGIERQHSIDGRWYEGVTLLIVNEEDRLAIGDIVWGRP